MSATAPSPCASTARRAYELSTPENQQALRLEGEQLARGPLSNGAGVTEDASVSTHSRRPLVLDVSERAKREVLRVLREDPSLQIVDRFDEQREQLGQIRPIATAPGHSTRASAGCTTRGVARSCGSSGPVPSPRCASTATTTS